MSERFVVWGAPGTGSVVVEAALTILGLHYDVEAMSGVADAAIATVNPMRQVPALLLPSGQLMTESAAILIWLADEYPAHHLGPAVGDVARPAFLRWMSFVSAAIYSLYWIRDEPSRVAPDGVAEVVLQRTAERISACWAIMEAQVSPGAYVLGDQMSVLDLYIAVVSRFQPRRARFHETAPRLGEVVRRVDADPRLAALWAERYPFEQGWEG